MAPMRAKWLLLGSVLLVGCRAAPPPAPEPAPDDARIRELESRITWLEAQVRAATFVDDEILSLQVQRAAMLVTYAPDHPAILGIDRKIQAIESVRALENRARRAAMLRRLEEERGVLLGTYTPDNPGVRKLDAKIAFLKSDAG